MKIITSRDNPAVKKFFMIQKSRREREKSGTFAAEGARFCREAVLSHACIKSVFLTQEFMSRCPDDARLIIDACADVMLISDDISKKLSETVKPQGIFCLCAIPDNSTASINGKNYIVLENLQDPGNIGTIIRTAEAFGIDGVVISASCADVYSPKVLRSTMGTIFRIPIIRHDDIKGSASFFKSRGYTVFGAVPDSNLEHLSKINFPEKSVCLIGNEANGLSDAAKSECERFVYIDMNGNAESLNAAIAASVIMWEMCGR